MDVIPLPDAPCMGYLSTFYHRFIVNVSKYSIHGAFGSLLWQYIIHPFRGEQEMAHIHPTGLGTECAAQASWSLLRPQALVKEGKADKEQQ